MDKLRQSVFSCYEVCPKLCSVQFGTPGKPGVDNNDPKFQNKYNTTGIAFHEVMEEWGKRKIKNNDMFLDEMKELLISKLDNIPLEYFDNPEDLNNFKFILLDELEYCYDLYCNTTPIAVEWTFDIENLIPGLPPITGTADRLEGSLKHKDVDIMDYKTGSHKKYTKKELRSNIQATLYSLAFKHEFGFYPKRFIFVFPKFKKEKVINITDEFIEEGLIRIKSLWYKMASNQFNAPEKPNKFYCANFCPLTEKECARKGHKRYKNNWDKIKYERFVPESSAMKMK